MNIKKVEKEFKFIYPTTYSKMDTNMKIDFKFFLAKVIKQVVRSVPVKKINTKGSYERMGILQHDYGYNRHIQKVKQWKRKILNELEKK